MSSSAPRQPPSLEKWLKDHDIPTATAKSIRKLGVNRVCDLVDLDEEDITSLSLKKLEGKRLRRGIADLKLKGEDGGEDPVDFAMLTDANHVEGTVFDVWGALAWTSFREKAISRELTLKEKLDNFYARHNPTKIGEVEDIMVTYEPNPGLLWEHLLVKYCLFKNEDGLVYYQNMNMAQRANATLLATIVPGVLVGSDQGEQGVRSVRSGMLVLPVKCLTPAHKQLLGVVASDFLGKTIDNGIGMKPSEDGNTKTVAPAEETINIPIVLKEYVEPGSVIALTSSVKELSYEFKIGNGFHQIKVSHSMHMGLRTIQVDGVTVEDTISGVLYDSGSEHHFECAGFNFTFTIRLHGTFFSLSAQCFTYELLAEGYGVKEPQGDYRDAADDALPKPPSPAAEKKEGDVGDATATIASEGQPKQPPVQVEEPTKEPN